MIKRTGLALRREGTDPADVYLDAQGHLVMVHDAEAIGQHARQRLMTFEGEWFLDREAGVPWVRNILGGQYDPVLAEAVIKVEILDTDGVVDINSFSVRFDRSVRGLSAFNIEVLTEYDKEVDL